MQVTANISIWGEFVGAVAWNEAAGAASFEYDAGFASKKWDLSPLKMPHDATNRIFSFPELRGVHTYRGLPGLLADVLPDKYGNRLINAWLARNGRPENSYNPVELLCFIGTRGMGALEFEPAVFTSGKRAVALELDSLVEAARSMLSIRESFETSLTTDEGKSPVKPVFPQTSAPGILILHK